MTTTTEQISTARKAARWATHETAMDLRHVADLMVKESVNGTWKDLLSAAQDTEELARELARKSVATARAHGASWAEIGQLLGTTRQAAQQRYST